MNLILTNPTGNEIMYALRSDFYTSNNKAEYESLLAGLRLAVKMGAERIVALTDSYLAANQVTREFEVKDKRMEKYVKAVQQITILLNSFSIKQNPRGSNRRADALSRLASTCFCHLSKEVLVEVVKERSIDECQVESLSTTRPNWMTPIIDYLQHGILPGDHEEARKIRIQAPQYAILGGALYTKGNTSSWLKCIDNELGKKAFQEAHAGSDGARVGARALISKILCMGIY